MPVICVLSGCDILGLSVNYAWVMRHPSANIVLPIVIFRPVINLFDYWRFFYIYIGWYLYHMPKQVDELRSSWRGTCGFVVLWVSYRTYVFGVLLLWIIDLMYSRSYKTMCCILISARCLRPYYNACGCGKCDCVPCINLLLYHRRAWY